MAAGAKAVVRTVKPILSVDHANVHRNVIKLYKSWYREIPNLILKFGIPYTKQQCLTVLRQEFRRHNHVTDIRVLDMLLVKGNMDLQEAAEGWKTSTAFTIYFKETWNKKPTDFMSKFIAGQE